MKRRTFLASALATTCFPVLRPAAQGTSEIVRIGWVTALRAQSLAPYVETFRAGLSELGYEEGRNLRIEYRYGDDDPSTVPQLAQDLMRHPVALIIATGGAASAVRMLNLPVPVVYVMSADPVSARLAESLSRPTGNMTGLTFMAAEMNGKRLEILREIIPNLSRVALIANPEHAGEHLERGYCEEVAQRLGLSLAYFQTRNSNDLTAAFQALASDTAGAICVFADGFAVQNRHRIVEFGMSQRIPVISGWAVFAQSGALCTYGPLLSESYRRLASYVERILKGAKPSDLPIERPTKFETIVNLRTARALDLTIPPTLLARADEVIE
jgi:putative tryptophan/tyrosine transport system substrate-binding protein